MLLLEILVGSFCLFRDLKQFYSSLERYHGAYSEYMYKSNLMTIPFIKIPVHKNPIKTPLSSLLQLRSAK